MRFFPFYIAKRYFLSRANTNAVNIITSIAIFAIMVATCALFIIISVFSGLEKMNIKFYSNVNPDLKISASKGKVLPNLRNVENVLTKDKSVVEFSKIIEEKVYVTYGNQEDIAYLKAVDINYKAVSQMDTAIVAGSYLNFKANDQLIISDGVSRRLQLAVDYEYPVLLMMPKSGEGLITSESDAFNRKGAYSVGVFFLNEQYDQYIFSPIGLAQDLLGLKPDQCYAIDIKTDGKHGLNDLKYALQEELGDQYVVKTRQDLDAAFLKVMNVENIIIYLIFTLVIFIASFNLAGTVIVIIIDKKSEIKAMRSFGMTNSKIKAVFLLTGVIITLFSLFFGLFFGCVLGLLQQKFGMIMASEYVPFPFTFNWQNFLIVILTVFGIGVGVSYIVSRKLPN